MIKNNQLSTQKNNKDNHRGISMVGGVQSSKPILNCSMKYIKLFFLTFLIFISCNKNDIRTFSTTSNKNYIRTFSTTIYYQNYPDGYVVNPSTLLEKFKTPRNDLIKITDTVNVSFQFKSHEDTVFSKVVMNFGINNIYWDELIPPNVTPLLDVEIYLFDKDKFELDTIYFNSFDRTNDKMSRIYEEQQILEINKNILKEIEYITIQYRDKNGEYNFTNRINEE